MPKILIFTSWDSPVCFFTRWSIVALGHPWDGTPFVSQAFIAGHPHADERHAIPVGGTWGTGKPWRTWRSSWWFPEVGVPQNGKSQRKMDDLGGTPILGHLHLGIPLYFFSKKIRPVRPPVVVKLSTCQAQKHMPHQAWLLTGKANLWGSFMSSKPVETQCTCSHPLNMGTEPSTKRTDRKRLLWIMSWVLNQLSTWYLKVFGVQW